MPEGITVAESMAPARARSRVSREPTPKHRSRVAFHVAGLAVTITALLGYAIAMGVLSIGTAGCESDPGSPKVLHVGVVILTTLLVATPAQWARRAFRRGFAGAPWLMVTALVAGLGGYSAATGWHVSGCWIDF